MHGRILPSSDRPYDEVSDTIRAIIIRIRTTAPGASIVVVSYPPILPPQGGCPALGIGADHADLSREVARRLALATQRAAREEGVILVDMAAEGIGHDACSTVPWVNGARPDRGAAFHPNAAGARATADRIMAAFGPLPDPPPTLSSSSARH